MKRHASLSFDDLSRPILEYLPPRALTNPFMYVVLGLHFGLLLTDVPKGLCFRAFVPLEYDSETLTVFVLFVSLFPFKNSFFRVLSCLIFFQSMIPSTISSRTTFSLLVSYLHLFF